jgi:hypothetical protein
MFEKLLGVLGSLCASWNLHAEALREEYLSCGEVTDHGHHIDQMAAILRQEISVFADLPALDLARLGAAAASKRRAALADDDDDDKKKKRKKGGKAPWTIGEMLTCHEDMKARFRGVVERVNTMETKTERDAALRQEALTALDVRKYCDQDLDLLTKNVRQPPELLRIKFWREHELELLGASGGLGENSIDQWLALHEEFAMFRTEGVTGFQPAILFHFPETWDPEAMFLELATQAPPSPIELFRGGHPGYTERGAERIAGEYAALCHFAKEAATVVNLSSGDRQIIASRYCTDLEVYQSRVPKTKKKPKKGEEEDVTMEEATSVSLKLSDKLLDTRERLVGAYTSGEGVRPRGREFEELDVLSPLEFVDLKSSQEKTPGKGAPDTTSTNYYDRSERKKGASKLPGPKDILADFLFPPPEQPVFRQ